MRGRVQRLTEQEAQRALHELGLLPSDFQRIDRASTYALKCQYLDSLKAKAKKGYRAAARRLHPDRAGNDEKQVELLRLVIESYKQIEKLKVRPPQPAMRRVRVTFTHVPGFRGATAPRRTSTAYDYDPYFDPMSDGTTTASTGGPFRVRRVVRRG